MLTSIPTCKTSSGVDLRVLLNMGPGQPASGDPCKECVTFCHGHTQSGLLADDDNIQCISPTKWYIVSTAKSSHSHGHVSLSSTFVCVNKCRRASEVVLTFAYADLISFSNAPNATNRCDGFGIGGFVLV